MTKNLGGRPRKRDLTDVECKLAIAELERGHALKQQAWLAAVQAVNRHRDEVSQNPERHVSPRTLQRALAAQGHAGKTPRLVSEAP